MLLTISELQRIRGVADVVEVGLGNRKAGLNPRVYW
jgi:hypothetical protein